MGEGTGLGLAIADEIARLHGTQLQFSDAAEALEQAAPPSPRRGLWVSVLLATAPPYPGPSLAQDTPAFTRGIRMQ